MSDPQKWAAVYVALVLFGVFVFGNYPTECSLVIIAYTVGHLTHRAWQGALAYYYARENRKKFPGY